MPFAQYFTAGIAATGTMAVAFQGVAIAIASDRRDKTLTRLRGLPMPRISYFLGKLLSALVSGLLQTSILLAVSAAFFGLHLPDSFQKVEPAGSWEHGKIALILLAWIVGGLLVSLRTFRRQAKRGG